MNFLNEAVYNVEKGAMPPNPEDLKDDDVVNIGEDDIDEGKLKNFLTGAALFTALIAGNNAITNSNPQMKALKNAYEKAEDVGDKEKMKVIKDKITKQRIFLDTGKGDSQSVKEEDIKLPSDTTFTVDLKHLVKKHMNKGNDKESAIKFTKALMKKLHNKGEVNVDGTKVIFKEMKMDQDTPLALPAAETPNFLGDDGMDYEGGMAKSQMLKMKKYVDALSNMIEDESQLESWVQAKLTKASDYMSAVYHYLDYQKSKMNELNEAEMSVNVNRKDDEVEVTYKGERYKSALGDELVFIHYFKDGEYHGENDAPKTFKYLKGKGGKLEVDEKEATLTINMSNLK